jgi:hypothetical protein
MDSEGHFSKKVSAARSKSSLPILRVRGPALRHRMAVNVSSEGECCVAESRTLLPRCDRHEFRRPRSPSRTPEVVTTLLKCRPRYLK